MKYRETNRQGLWKLKVANFSSLPPGVERRLKTHYMHKFMLKYFQILEHPGHAWRKIEEEVKRRKDQLQQDKTCIQRNITEHQKFLKSLETNLNDFLMQAEKTKTDLEGKKISVLKEKEAIERVSSEFFAYCLP